MHRVVIIGGGFGGLYAARALAGADVEITLLDRRNHHLFQPLLYQVATATLNPSDIAVPIRSVLRHQRNVQVLLGDASAIDPDSKVVRLADGADVPYDFLIVATGATHSYFGHDDWETFAPGLKSIEDALEIRRRTFLAFEAAERASDLDQRRAWMTFVVIGAGATGVEMAGALSEIARQSLRDDFRSIDPGETRIVLVEGLPRVLPVFPESLGVRAEARLKKLGVEVRTGSRVTAVDGSGVNLGDERIPARTVIWAAGVAASPLARSLGVPLDRAGRVLVQPSLAVPGHDDVFVVGDLAALEQDGHLIPGVSPAAMQGGRHAAGNIMRALRGQPAQPFHYLDKGSFAVIGRGAAVGHFRERLKLSGFIAWFAWLFIHLFFLIGFRNRALVMFDWAYSYLTFRRGARLITGAIVYSGPSKGPAPPAMGSGEQSSPTPDAIVYSGPSKGPAPPAMGSGEQSSPTPDAIVYSGPSKGPAPPAMGSGEQSSPTPDAIVYSGPSKGPAPPAMGSGEQSSPTPDAMIRDPQRAP